MQYSNQLSTKPFNSTSSRDKNMIQPIIGFAGLTHLGINTAVASAARGFKIAGFHKDKQLIASLEQGEIPLTEPDLPELFAKHHDQFNFSDQFFLQFNLVDLFLDGAH